MIALSKPYNAPLLESQLRFCEEYLVDSSSASDAARRAGYKDAHGQSNRLLKDPRVQAYLASRREEIGKRMGITPERVLREFASIAYFNLTDYLEEDDTGEVRINLHKLRHSKAASALQECSVTTKTHRGTKTTTVRVKQADKVAALTSIAKHLGMMAEKLEVSGKIDFLKLVEDSYTLIDQPSPELLEHTEAEFEEIPPETPVVQPDLTPEPTQDEPPVVPGATKGCDTSPEVTGELPEIPDFLKR